MGLNSPGQFRALPASDCRLYANVSTACVLLSLFLCLSSPRPMASLQPIHGPFCC